MIVSPLMSFIYFFCIFTPWHVLFEDFCRDQFYDYFIIENASTLKLESRRQYHAAPQIRRVVGR